MASGFDIDPARQTVSEALNCTMGDLGLTFVNLFPAQDWNNFVNDFFDYVSNDLKADGDRLIAEYLKRIDGIDDPKITGEVRLLYLVKLGIYNCWWAIQALEDGADSAAWSFISRANRFGGMAIAAEHAFNNIPDKSAFAISGVRAKLAKDPKQTERRFVLQCWKGWKENPARYSSKAAFARDMLEKCEHLISSKKIEDWCRIWERTQP